MEILVLDDEAQILELCRRGIEGGAFKVTTAASAKEALAYLSLNRFDILLTDIHMEPPGGLELTQTVHDHYPDMDVIIMTGYPTMDTVIKAIKLGAYDYLTKPLDLILIKAAIKRCLEKRSLHAKISLVERSTKGLAATASSFLERFSETHNDPQHKNCLDFAQKILLDVKNLQANLKPDSMIPKKSTQ